MPSFTESIEGYLKELDDRGLADAEIYFNSLQTMSVGGLLRELLKFYPTSEHSEHQLDDNEELRLAAEFNAFFALLEAKRSQAEGPVIDKQLTQEMNRFMEQLDHVFAKLYDRDANKQAFPRDYFKEPHVKGLVKAAVVNLLRGTG